MQMCLCRCVRVSGGQMGGCLWREPQGASRAALFGANMCSICAFRPTKGPTASWISDSDQWGYLVFFEPPLLVAASCTRSCSPFFPNQNKQQTTNNDSSLDHNLFFSLPRHDWPFWLPVENSPKCYCLMSHINLASQLMLQFVFLLFCFCKKETFWAKVSNRIKEMNLKNFCLKIYWPFCV